MKLSAYWHLLRGNRNLRLLWIAQIVSETGDWFYSVAIFSFLLDLTGSAQMVALAFLMQVLPQVFVSPAAGVINDRLSRRKVMMFADWSRAVIVFAMMLVRTRPMLPLLYVLLLLETLCWALFEPGRSAVIPNITSEEDVPVANALGSTTWSVNFALGAGLGGLALVTFGRTTVFVLNSLSFVASALLIRRMKFAEPHAENLPPLRFRDLFDFSPILEGVRYVRAQPKLIATMLVKAGVGIAGANWVILPVLGERIFRVQLGRLSASQAGALGMSTLLASRGVGALLGSLFSGSVAGTNRGRLGWSILGGFAMIGVGYVALGRAQSMALAVLALIFAHAGGSTCWTSSTTLLQQQTEDRFRGRVFSTEFAFMTLMLAISSFLSGRAMDWGVDVRTVAIATGVTMTVPFALWLWASRVWRR